MKKKNLKSLNLNKKTISSFKKTITGGVRDQTMLGGACPQPTNIFNTCGVCETDVTCESAICPSWWGGELCPAD